jgi:hypothetical protein
MARAHGLMSPADGCARAPERRHGLRLACFRPVRRFSVAGEDDASRPMTPWDLAPVKRSAMAATARGTPVKQQLACDCESQVLQCHFAGADAKTRADVAQVEELYLARLRKWSDKFDAHDWKQERVCQKWKENQKRFELESEARAAGNEATPAEREKDGGHRRTMAATSSSWTDVEVDAEEDEKLSPSKAAGQAVRQAFTSLTSAAEVLIQSRQFDNLVRGGIPPQLRGQVWWMCSGAADLKEAATESYAELVQRSHTLSKSTAMDIEKDLPRTFPVDLNQSQDMSASFGAGVSSASGVWENDGARRRYKSISELRRVLQAYSLRNPSIGYCQSMNFLAAVLLHQMEEEEAFWVLTAIVEELTPMYHTRSMAGSRADQRVFSDLVQQKLPALYRHMQRLGVDFEPFTLKWFLCLFLNTLPFEPVMRIWDVFFCEGSHVLLRVGLALLKLNQPRIMACDDAFDVYEMFKLSHDMLQAVTAPYRSGLLNRDECVCDTLIRLSMDKSFVGPIPFDSLHELRVFYRNEIEEELRVADARREEQARIASSRQSAVSSSGSCHAMPTSVHAALSSDDPSRGIGLQHSAPGCGNGSETEEADSSSTEQEYDFVEEYANRDSEISPAKHIHFLDLYDSDDALDYFIDVKYDLTCSLPPIR